MEFHFPHCALIHRSAWKANSRKSPSTILHGSLLGYHSEAASVPVDLRIEHRMLRCRIKMRVGA
jgi:hypothetical protein